MNDNLDIIDYIESLGDEAPPAHAPDAWRAMGDERWQREQQVADDA